MHRGGAPGRKILRQEPGKVDERRVAVSGRQPPKPAQLYWVPGPGFAVRSAAVVQTPDIQTQQAPFLRLPTCHGLCVRTRKRALPKLRKKGRAVRVWG